MFMLNGGGTLTVGGTNYTDGEHIGQAAVYAYDSDRGSFTTYHGRSNILYVNDY